MVDDQAQHCRDDLDRVGSAILDQREEPLRVERRLGVHRASNAQGQHHDCVAPAEARERQRVQQ
jgi:hypothetical protein